MRVRAPRWFLFLVDCAGLWWAVAVVLIGLGWFLLMAFTLVMWFHIVVAKPSQGTSGYPFQARSYLE